MQVRVLPQSAHLKERLPVIADADKWDRIETHEPNSWGKFLEASGVKTAIANMVAAGPSQMHRRGEIFCWVGTVATAPHL